MLAEAKYDVMKDLELNGQFRFKHQFNDEMNFKDQYLGDKDLFEKKKEFKGDIDYIHSYALGMKYGDEKKCQILI